MVENGNLSNGGRTSCDTGEQNQALVEKCGIKSPIEGQREIRGAPAPKKRAKGILIGDEEIRSRYGDRADAILAELDADRHTRREQFYKGFRVRDTVEKKLALIDAR